ncbi:MAG: phenylalanine--tRNA ligase subunit beta [Gemmatimonadota bacterium]
MIVSHEWLKQFVPHTLSAQEIGDLLSRHCVTLDSIESTGADLSAFVVAQVVEAGRHPNSERLWVTKVDDGSGTLLDVVCGAPNVVQGHKYPFARTGTAMPGGLVIEKRKIRGETSNGMLCSARELGLGEEHDGILTLDTDAAPGTPLVQVLPAGDARLDLDVLPNRPDLLSHLGVAREISAITGVPFGASSDIAPREHVEVTGWVGDTEASGEIATVRVEDSESCPQYSAITVKGVKVGPSPEWLRERLASIGQRSISNIVDVTNYVLHGFGQPVHAFDLAKLAGATIVVRPTRDGETLVTLDGVERTITPGTTVICDAERPVALAGIMGGRDSEVTETTTDILLEVAHFEPRFVRRVRRAVGLSTDASYRFERGVDAYALGDVAMTTAVLITQVAGGEIVDAIEVGDAPLPASSVRLRVARVASLLGVALPTSQIAARLESLGCTVVSATGAAVTEPDVAELLVNTPSWRHDLLLEVDLIEEVARLGGFDALPDEVRPFRPGNAPDHPLHVAGRRVRSELVALGLAEARPMPFTATGDDSSPRVRNPLAEDEPFLRASLLDTLARRAEYNLSRMQGNIRLFEIGNAFVPRGGRLPREEVRVAALVTGARRPPHFTEPNPPAYDRWDAKHIAERMAGAAFDVPEVTFAPGEGDVVWRVLADGHGEVGTVSRVALDKPVWAGEVWGVELTLGALSSDDVAAAGKHLGAQPGAVPDALAVMPATAPGAAGAIRYRALPVTPAAEFDLALLVPEGTSAADVSSAMRRAGGELLERVELFDEFRGAGVPAGYRSLGWRLTFRHPERTLREKEIEGRRSRLLDTLSAELGIKPRAS